MFPTDRNQEKNLSAVAAAVVDSWIRKWNYFLICECECVCVWPGENFKCKYGRKLLAGLFISFFLFESVNKP